MDGRTADCTGQSNPRVVGVVLKSQREAHPNPRGARPCDEPDSRHASADVLGIRRCPYKLVGVIDMSTGWRVIAKGEIDGVSQVIDKHDREGIWVVPGPWVLRSVDRSHD